MAFPKDNTQKLRDATARSEQKEARLKTDSQPLIKDTPELIALALESSNFSEETKEKIKDGVYEVLGGEDPGRPVVRVKGNQRVVAGSGRYPHKAPLPEQMLATKYKKTKTYREALESLIPLFPDKDAHHSFEELVENFFKAISDKERAVTCEHPGCTQKHMWVPNVDAGAVFKMIENLAGKAVEQKKIEVSNTFDIAEYRTFDVTIHGISLDTAQLRRQELLAAGVIESSIDGEYREISTSDQVETPDESN